MYSPSTIASLLPFLSVVLAQPLQTRDAPQFIITSLGATFPEPGPFGDESVDSSVSIAVTYPDPASTSSGTLDTTCRVGWPSGTNPGPTAWTPCANPALQFRLPTDGWTSTRNFRVELWETLTADGAGLDGTQLLKSNPGNPSDPDTYMFCVQRGKFNPLTCNLTGPFGTSARTVVIPASEGSTRPN
ncbi:hypothetical protein JX265_008427 [Neoarthrinium moseri]|uniref:Uncharacterized protein n=1 Tax=Neoarthrinium moseri TaxID=1658444 RepID=A0A9Q0AK60_9PEZI|nr:uncharacterized protein JN550_001431 [Neoarthrinium moseri]KAI1844988.1 hypothetical protein JX266_008781 [Neoarthrinium moseri]KAI1864703.1 hypothetical protein JX265_008427 [Neoarthrinium moseri]KAI1875935.1 hypothetical protein JN550_001431 [Neoarthrinium moseri]